MLAEPAEMARFNAWANARLHAAAATLPPEEVARDRGAFFGSILGTLNHILLVDILYRERLEGRETRFKSLFENAPIPIREEDLSGMKRRIDALNLPDPDDFAAYVDAHPEFLDACASEIVVVDANRASLAQHGYAEKAEMLAKVVRTLLLSLSKA